MKNSETLERKRGRTPKNRTTTGFRISDELWAVLYPLLPVPPNSPHLGGRPRVPDRDCADAIFYILKTGGRWQALDQTELCPHSTAHDRFQEWVQAGVFLKLWQQELDIPIRVREKQTIRTRPWEVSDALWKRVEPLIPERVSHVKGGRPPEDDRKMFTAIVYVLRTGIQKRG
jgi:transposase